jgi:antitoxin (DNA-binding transcriptional repressor) of toxin-antitoxin stability system
MVRRIQLAKFRSMIREIVDAAAHGQPTVLTHYKREVAAVVPMSMVNPPIPPEVPPAKKPSPSKKSPTHRNRQEVS